VCFSVLVCVAVCCSVLQCVAVCCSVLHYIAVCCSVMCDVWYTHTHAQPFPAMVCCSVLRCVAVCCSVLQCVAVCCSVLQRVTVCCGVLQCDMWYTHTYPQPFPVVHRAATLLYRDRNSPKSASCHIIQFIDQRAGFRKFEDVLSSLIIFLKRAL